MTWCRVGSSPATAARAATVFPAPTSPVMTPSRIWSMQKLIRAVAWAWAWRANRSPAAIALPNGVRASPKGAVHVPADHERHRGPGRAAVQEHLDHGQVLRVVPQLNAPPGQGGIDGVGV